MQTIGYAPGADWSVKHDPETRRTTLTNPERLLSLRPLLEAGQTLTSKLGGSETNISYGDPLHWAAIVGLGLILLVLTGALTVLGTGLSSFRAQPRNLSHPGAEAARSAGGFGRNSDA